MFQTPLAITKTAFSALSNKCIYFVTNTRKEIAVYIIRRLLYTAKRATEAYQKECAKWEEACGEKVSPKAETMHEKIQRYKEKADRQNANQPYQSKDKGAR